MTAVHDLVEALELDPNARSTRKMLHVLQSEREFVLRALTEVQSRIERLADGLRDEDTWLQVAQREGQTLGYTGVGTRWAEAEARLAKITAILEVQ